MAAVRRPLPSGSDAAKNIVRDVSFVPQMGHSAHQPILILTQVD